MQSSDLREELKNRMDKAKEEIDKLLADRQVIEELLSQAQTRLNTWREAYTMETERLGKPALPLFSTEGEKSYRFSGMKVGEALDIIRKEQPEIDKKGALEILSRGNFDFRGKRPLPAVHFAWVALDRRRK